MATNGDVGPKATTLSQVQELFIGGKHKPSSDNAEFQVINPMTGANIYSCASATVDDVSEAIESAHTAFKSWSRMGPSARRSIFLKAADILEGYIHGDASEILASEVSATATWVKVNIFSTANVLREAAGLVTHIKGEIVPADRPGTTVLITREPLGVMYAISPWNAPVSLFSSYTLPFFFFFLKKKIALDSSHISIRRTAFSNSMCIGNNSK